LPRRTLARDILLVLAGSLLTALSAYVAFPLPFSPVPVTGQTFAVLLVGAMLGSKRGAMSMALYVAEGTAGLPVFAGGAAGPGVLLGPSGGYLLGFVAAAFVTGWLAERSWDRQLGTAVLAMAAGNLVIYASGLAWLVQFVGAHQVLALGILPFLLGDAIKIGAAALVLPAGWRVLRRKDHRAASA
jgi:biotin transport system substrate-specific component